jgi:hypothetical protein
MLTSLWTIKELLKEAVDLLDKGQERNGLDLVLKALQLAKMQFTED